jgi:mannose-6-phosphate isomerase-like protein (cupin superfamily)
MRFLAGDLGAEQVAFTYRRMPAGTGSKGSYGHRHRTQEEIYFVIVGTLQFKLDDDVIDVGPLTAVRIAPPTVRGVWNEGPDDAQLVICSTKVDDLGAEGETVDGFWPAD